MVIIRVWGGIGNQLFEYAFGKYIENTHNLKVVYDIGSFGTSDTLRSNEIQELFPELPIIHNIKFSQKRGIQNRLYRWLYQLNNKFILERNFEENVLSQQSLNKGDIYLQGYWQKLKYASFILPVLCKLKFKDFPESLNFILKQIEGEECPVSIHIRRGDYFQGNNASLFGVCDPKYFHKAISIISENYPNCRFFVFSDDLEYVRLNIQLPNNAVYVPNLNVPQYSYIALMSCCHHNIISNSTFSWWGAYINETPNKLVICPSRWTLKEENTISPLEWKRI